MAELVQIWNSEICPRLDLGRLLADLDPRQTGDNVYLRCPVCNARGRAFIKKGWDYIKCNRDNGCGEATALLAYLNNNVMPTGRDWVNAVRELGKTVGVTIPEKQFTPEQLEKFKVQREQQSLMDRVLTHCKGQVIGAAQYLTGRGFKTENFDQLEFGFAKDLGKHFTEEELKPLGLDAPAWNNRFIFPLRDRYSVLRGLCGRSLNGSEPKFLKTTGYPKEQVLLEGLDVAKQYKHILAGESSIAVFSFREHGIPEMTAAGGTDWKPEVWEQLFDWGFESVTLCFDDDKAGGKGLRKAIDAALKAKQCPDIYIIPNEWLGGLDPDEYLRKYGRDAWKALEVKRLTMDKYMAHALANEFDLTSSIGYQSYLDSSAKYLASFDDPRRSAIAWEQFFKQGVQIEAQIDEDYFFDFMISEKQRKEEEKIKAALADANNAIRKAAFELDIEKAREVVSQANQSLIALEKGHQTRPLMRASQRLQAHDQYLLQHCGRKFLGLPQRTLPTLDDATLGMRGLTGIAGGPGSGKTTLAIQIGEDILRNNDDTCLLIVSLEMAEEELLTRMKSRATGLSYDRLLLTSDEKIRHEANEAIHDIARRLFIIDKSIYPEVNVDLILRDASRLKAETGCDRVVIVIDYIQIYPIPQAVRQYFRTEIEQDCWRVDEIYKLRRAIWPDPVLFISELSKGEGFKAGGLHSLKGSSRIAYAADNVFIVNPIDEEALIDRVELLQGGAFRLKNKPSRYGNKRKKQAPASGDELEQIINNMLDECDHQGKSFVDFEVAKVRGGRRKRFVIAHKHTCSDMKELTADGERTS